MSIFALNDSQIEFIKRHPESLFSFIEGEKPEINTGFVSKYSRLLSNKAQVLKDWPIEPVEMINPVVTHKNVELYHYLLNGTDEIVFGAGSLFQTWFNIKEHSAISMDSCNDNFAFSSAQIPELLGLLNDLSFGVFKSRFDKWFQIKDLELYETEESYQETYRALIKFRNGVEIAVRNKHGLMWIH